MNNLSKIDGAKLKNYRNDNNSTVGLSGEPTVNLAKIQNEVLTILKNDIDLNLLDDITINSEIDCLGFTSISFIKIIVELEKNFNFEFDDEMLQYTKFNNIKSIIDYVEFKLNDRDK